MYDPTCVPISISLNYQKIPLELGVTDTNLLNITVITT